MKIEEVKKILEWWFDKFEDRVCVGKLNEKGKILNGATKQICQLFELKPSGRLLTDERIYHDIREILREVNGIRNFGMGTAYNDYVDRILAKTASIYEARIEAQCRICLGEKPWKPIKNSTDVFVRFSVEDIQGRCCNENKG